MRKWLHRALKGASLTAALFVFQACYGTPPGPLDIAESERPDVMEQAEGSKALAEAPDSGEETVEEEQTNADAE